MSEKKIEPLLDSIHALANDLIASGVSQVHDADLKKALEKIDDLLTEAIDLNRKNKEGT